MGYICDQQNDRHGDISMSAMLSGYDYCDTYAKKHRSREHYHRKKQAKFALTQIMIGNLKINKNNTTVTSITRKKSW